MSTTKKPTAPTPEEIKAQQVRALAQQRASLAQGVLFNALHNPDFNAKAVPPADLAQWSVDVAEALMDCLYNPKHKDAE